MNKHLHISQKRFRFAAVALILFCALFARAQNRQHIFERLQGVFVQPPTHSMDLDEYGRLWYGTWGRGIFMYDGYEFTRFQQESGNPNALSNDRILALKTDKRQRVWISTMNGLDCLNRRTGQVLHFGNIGDSIFQCTSLFEDRQGVVWAAGAKGVLRFNESQQQFENIKPLQAGVKPARANQFFEDSGGRLWMGRADGLFLFNTERSGFSHIPVYQSGTPDEPFRVISIVEQPDRSFWLAGLDGILQFDPFSAKTSWPMLPDSILQSRISAMLPDEEGGLWLAVPDDGLYRWEPRSGILQAYSHNVFDPNSLPSNQVHALAYDPFGNLWVGTDRGIARLPLLRQPFSRWLIDPSNPDLPANQIQLVAQDSRGGILVHTGAGLYYMPQWGAVPQRLVSGKQHSLNFDPDDFIRDHEGNIWAIYDGLYRWQPESQSFVLVPTSLQSQRIMACAQDAEMPNIWWLGTLKGVHQLDMRSGEIKNYELPIPPAQARGVAKILDDKQGHIWVSAPAMLLRLDKKSGAMETYTSKTAPPKQLANDEVTDLDLSPDGSIWAATSSGLSRIQVADGVVQNYTLKDGLPDPLILSGLMDQAQRLWLVFPEHMAQFDPQRGRFSTWSTANLLQTGQLARRAGWLLQDGALLVASRSGLVRIASEQVSVPRPPGHILLTRFETSHPQSIPGLEFLQHIQLANNQNSLTIGWAAIQTAQSATLLYECQLEKKGQKTLWEYKGTDRQAVYTNLDPGAYTFKVRIAGSNAPELRIDIAIAPAWYQAESFKMLLMALFATAAYLFWRNREDNRELIQQKELAEQNARYKTRFLANMSHEIRTPMNAILGLSRLLTESKLPPKQSEYADAIRQSSENLLVIVNDVLDQVKIESGKFTFQQKPFELDLIVRHLQNTLGFKAEEKGVQFAIELDSGTPVKLVGDPVRLNQILTNLLGNAIKFTDQGKITLHVASLEEVRGSGKVMLEFVVRDTGIGIAPEQRARVFESFQQADEEVSVLYGGTGLGLSITKDLVEQQGGSIDLNSEQGKGTEVVVRLPFLPDENREMAVEQVTDTPYDFGALRVLLVEDTFFNQMLAIELLKNRIPQVHIEVAENGRIALEKMESGAAFDLVLMDVKMPVMDGLEATRRLRANPEWETLPIIALTANAVQEELDKCKQVGMNAWVTKPIDAAELFAWMKKVLKA
ncbi:MAG TPA: ATP-binding protein [Saprospiraceae bacterium]|nr:ATP-binding protein [Saprospiraceae bacterium]